ncbi:hypothetical protein ACFY8P_18905 [Streptomyces sp. NPDC012693]|uniref:hypothetical protein n=1 Tax=unclassified Streptomyces TaxID=2593676 RepID=UPI002030FDE8|nr:hypothetical protein [Streptomyces sp. MSC1_001]
MSRRVSLPGADELFRTTGGTALQASAPRRAVPAPAGESAPQAAEGSGSAEHTAADSESAEPRARTAEAESAAAKAAPSAAVPAPAARRRGGRTPNRRPSGRERHDEKITVYVSAEELMDLEHARLVLRGEHGLAVDRGRIVREAVAVVLADLESRGDASILVRRLRGR